jgi:hypothetical protein
MTGFGWLGVGDGWSSSLTRPEEVIRDYCTVQTGTEFGSAPKAGPR